MVEIWWFGTPNLWETTNGQPYAKPQTIGEQGWELYWSSVKKHFRFKAVNEFKTHLGLCSAGSSYWRRCMVILWCVTNGYGDHCCNQLVGDISTYQLLWVLYPLANHCPHQIMIRNPSWTPWPLMIFPQPWSTSCPIALQAEHFGWAAPESLHAEGGGAPSRMGTWFIDPPNSC